MKTKKGFSLTELLIVVTVLAFIFAAAAPIITKRRSYNQNFSNEAVWYYATNDPQSSAYFNPGVKSWPSIAFFGINPDDYFNLSSADSKMGGKVTIKAGPVSGAESTIPQRQIQFRYGADMGLNAGTFFVDNKGNMMLGGTYSNMLSIKDGNYNETVANSKTQNSTVLGVHSANLYPVMRYGTVVGSNSLLKLNTSLPAAYSATHSIEEPYSIISNHNHNEAWTHIITTVGSGAGKYYGNYESVASPLLSNVNSTFVGANAGMSRYLLSANLVVGANSASNEAFDGGNNTFIGADTGNTEFMSNQNSGHYVYQNTIVGSGHYVGTSDGNGGSKNTILGYGVFLGGHPGVSNMVAAGTGACESFSNYYRHDDQDSSSRTCIGYSSGATAHVSSASAPNSGDGFMSNLSSGFNHRIFLGGLPQGGSYSYPGRAVLEVHNVQGIYKSGKISVPNSTVVLNSNLYLKGNLISTYSESSLDAYPFHPTAEKRSGRLDCKADGFVKYSKWKCRWYGCWPVYAYRYVCQPYADKFLSGNLFDKIWNTIFNVPVIGDIGEDLLMPHHVDAWYNLNRPKTDNEHSLSPSGSSGLFGVRSSYSYLPNYITSDLRLKENLESFNSDLSKVLQLQPYNYTFKSDKKKVPQVGVIAQDLLKVFPESVTKDKDGYYQIRWDEMFYALINAIKELNKKVEKIASDITGMEVSIKGIKSGHKNVKTRISELNKRAARLEREVLK